MRTTQDHVFDVYFGPNDDTLIIGDQSGRVEIWDYSKRKVLASKTSEDSWLSAIAFNGHLVAAVYQTKSSNDYKLRRCRVELIKYDDIEEFSPKMITDRVEEPTSVAFSPNGLYIAVGSTSGSLRVWEVSSLHLLYDSGYLYTICYEATFVTNERLITRGLDSTIDLWTCSYEPGFQVGRLTCERTLEGHRLGIQKLTHHENFNWVLSGGCEGEIMFWDLDNGTADACLVGHKGLIHCVAISPKAGNFATCSWDGTVKIWR